MFNFCWYAYYVGSYVHKNKTTIFDIYTVIYITKLSIYTFEKLGIVDIIKKRISSYTVGDKYIIVDLQKTVYSDIGDFELIDIIY